MARDTIIERLLERADEHANVPALFSKRGGSWQPTTWGTYRDRVLDFAAGLLHLGHPAGKPIAILGFNSEEWCVSLLSGMALGAAGAGVYTTCSPEEVKYILEHSEAFAIICENGKRWKEQIRPIQGELPGLAHVILIETDPEVEADPKATTFAEVERLGKEAGRAGIEKRLADLDPDACGTLIYTSGTTGPPKAVMLSYRSVAWTAEVSRTPEIADLGPHDVLLSYLPLSHIAEQMFSIHSAVTAGTVVYFAESLDKLKNNLTEVRPTVFFGVPRVWEKFYAALGEKLGAASGVKGLLLRWARGVGTKIAPYRHAGKPFPWFLQKQYNLAKKLIFSKLRTALGLDRLQVAVSGAAPISREVLEFFQSLDITIQEVYGQSEDCGPTTFSRPGHIRFGTVGPAFPGVEVKIAEDGEILVKGPNVFMGYLKNEAATAETLKDGWLYTGDVGEFDADGFLRITDRKKDLIITAGGKNISPQNIEGLLKNHPLIEQAVCIGDRRKFVSALVTLSEEAATKWGKENGAAAGSLEGLAADDKIRAEIQSHVDKVNATLANVERLKRFTILPVAFSPETGELTPTMKVKRKIVNERYSDQIEAMYG